jgi:hypothetical protein
MTGSHTTAQRVFAHRRILQVTPQGYLAGVRLLAETAHGEHRRPGYGDECGDDHPRQVPVVVGGPVAQIEELAGVLERATDERLRVHLPAVEHGHPGRRGPTHPVVGLQIRLLIGDLGAQLPGVAVGDVVSESDQHQLGVRAGGNIGQHVPGQHHVRVQVHHGCGLRQVSAEVAGRSGTDLVGQPVSDVDRGMVAGDGRGVVGGGIVDDNHLHRARGVLAGHGI